MSLESAFYVPTHNFVWHVAIHLSPWIMLRCVEFLMSWEELEEQRSIEAELQSELRAGEVRDPSSRYFPWHDGNRP